MSHVVQVWWLTAIVDAYSFFIQAIAKQHCSMALIPHPKKQLVLVWFEAKKKLEKLITVKNDHHSDSEEKIVQLAFIF